MPTGHGGRTIIIAIYQPLSLLQCAVPGLDFDLSPRLNPLAGDTALMLLSILLHASPAEPGLRPVLPLDVRQVG